MKSSQGNYSSPKVKNILESNYDMVPEFKNLPEASGGIFIDSSGTVPRLELDHNSDSKEAVEDIQTAEKP